jgi:four helix bundle protein
MQDYTKLAVWRRARALTISVHEVVRAFPPRSTPGLRAQMERAVMSVAATIAEGAGRESRVDFARFLTMAIASSSELEHHLGMSRDLGMLDELTHDRLNGEAIGIRRMLFGLRRALLLREQEERAKRT